MLGWEMSISKREVWRSKAKLLALFITVLFHLFSSLALAQFDSKPNLNKINSRKVKTNKKRQKSLAEKLYNIFGPVGSLRMGYWSQNRQFSSQNNFLSNSAWLSLNTSGPAGLKFFYDGYVRNDDSTRTGPSTGDLREAYVDKSLGAVDFRIGRQIMVWGRADKINPTDNLGVKDLNLLTVEDDDQRTGLFATKTVLHFDDYSLIGVWLPEWRYTKFSIPTIPSVVTSEATPEHSAEQGALKFDHTGGSLDWSLSFYTGIDKTPDLAIASQTVTATNILFVHKKIRVFGADFAKNISSIAIRGEFAYEQTENADGQDLLTKNSFFEAVLGGDINITESFNINMQYVLKKIDNFHPLPNLPANVNFLVQEERLITQQLFETQQGISFRSGLKFLNDTLVADVSALYWFSQGDCVVSPKLTYAVSDHFKTSIGGNIYAGPDLSYLGVLKPLSAFYTEFKIIF
jgi:hypothetical protein